MTCGSCGCSPPPEPPSTKAQLSEPHIEPFSQLSEPIDVLDRFDLLQAPCRP